MHIWNSRARLAVGTALATLVGLTVTGSPASAGPGEDAKAPVIGTQRAGAIPGRYIVVLEPGSSGTDSARAVQQGRDLGEYMLEHRKPEDEMETEHWREFHSTRGILEHTASSAFLHCNPS